MSHKIINYALNLPKSTQHKPDLSNERDYIEENQERTLKYKRKVRPTDLEMRQIQDDYKEKMRVGK
jgi:hypothetical protein